MNRQEGGVSAGIAIAVLGGAIALLPWLRPQELRAPPWVVHACALAFVLAGCTVIARARKRRLLTLWLPVVVLAALVSPAIWLGFGSGERQCTLTAMQGLVRVFGTRADLPCRIGFAVAAVLGIALVLLALRQAIRASRPPAAD
jgi:hypothetical protein